MVESQPSESQSSGEGLRDSHPSLRCGTFTVCGLLEFAVETQEVAGGWKTRQTGCENSYAVALM